MSDLEDLKTGKLIGPMLRVIETGMSGENKAIGLVGRGGEIYLSCVCIHCPWFPIIVLYSYMFFPSPGVHIGKCKGRVKTEQILNYEGCYHGYLSVLQNSILYLFNPFTHPFLLLHTVTACCSQDRTHQAPACI